MRKLTLTAVVLAAFGLAPLAANAATLTVGTLTLGNVLSSSISCPLPANLAAPVAPGTTICVFSVLPAGWQGIITGPAGGADSAKFAVQSVAGVSALVVAGSAALTLTGSAAGNGAYVIGTVTSTP